MSHEAPASRTTNAVPGQRTGDRETTAGGPDPGQDPPQAPSAPVRPVPLDRLLSVAVLTPAQATLLAVQLLDAAGLRGTVDGEYLDGACLGAVLITPAGEVDARGPEPGSGSHVSDLLGQLLHNARRLPAHPRPEQLALLHRLEDTVADPRLDPSARARELEQALAAALGPGARQRLVDQLAALVEAFAHVAPSVPAGHPAARVAQTRGLPRPVPAPPPARASARPPAPVAAPRPPSGPPGHARVHLHPRRRGRRLALVLIVVAVVLVGGGYLVLRTTGSGIVGAFGGNPKPAAPATRTHTHRAQHPAKHAQVHHRAVALAPRHAGAVTAVAVQKTGSCAPGRLCPVRVTVHVRRSTTARPVVWKVGAARLCKHGVVWSAPTRVTAQPGWNTVYADSSVRVPKGRSLALVALATSPARAQSRPVPVTGSSLHC